MVASISVRVFTGTDAGTQSAAVSGIDFLSADNATNSLANRTAYPVAANSKSYEKWVKLYVDTAPDNQVSTIRLWGDGAIQSSTSLYVGTTATGVTPTNSDSATATNDWTSYVTGTKFSWDTGTYSGTGAIDNFGVFQLDVDADAAPGNWSQETISYDYTEM